MRPVEIALQLVELIRLSQPIGVTELARMSGFPKSTAQRSLLALQKAGWLEMRDPERAQWSLTMRATIATAGGPTADQMILRSLALPVMEELRRATGETVALSYKFRASEVLIERLDGTKPVRAFQPYGSVSDLFRTAAGRAILGELPDERLDFYFRHPQNPAAPASLREELASIRARGFAAVEGEADQAVGAAIRDANGLPFAGLAVTAPAGRWDAETLARYGELVADAARRVSIGAAGQLALRDFA